MCQKGPCVGKVQHGQEIQSRVFCPGGEGGDYKLYEECIDCGAYRLIVVKGGRAEYTYRHGKERHGKERQGKERQGKERQGKERQGKERQGKERQGKERQGKERR